MLYACDGDWWDCYRGEVAKNFAGELWTQDRESALKHGLNWIAGETADGLGREKIHFGGNGGYQAINLAYLFGAVKIILLGFDMRRGPNNESHWHGNHPGNMNKSNAYQTWIKNFDLLAEDLKSEGVEVINATRETALKCFPKISLEEALC